VKAIHTSCRSSLSTKKSSFTHNWLHAFDATGDERKDQEVGNISFSTGPIKVTYAGLQFHLLRTIAWFLHLTLKESNYELGSDEFYVEELFVICVV
jgi:hypothetical protein